MNPDILKTDSRVVFFPVRHHSPTAALLVRQLIAKMQPAAILIEGPSDFNERMSELFLGHKLPVAIFTYFRTSNMQRSAFYPFCDYSPEWVAANTGKKSGARVEFIDMPWRLMATISTKQHLYADGELRDNKFIPLVCQKLGLASFDELWDELIESQPSIGLAGYMKRCHQLCYQMRHSQSRVDRDDIIRERFMAERITECAAQVKGKILVVTGGFHSHALFDRFYDLGEEKLAHDQEPDGDAENGDETHVGAALSRGANGDDADHDNDAKNDDAANAGDEAGDDDADVTESEIAALLSHEEAEWGIALTPYSYDRLDALTGYEAGMPSPGFYHQVFADRSQTGSGGASLTYQKMLFEAAKSLRERKQQVSSADLIAVETSAQALARLRGHENVWRADLVDGIMTALVKDEVVAGIEHPMLTAIHEALRGTQHGRLAEGTSLPPLVHEVLEIFDDYKISRRRELRTETVELDLINEEDLKQSQIFHRLSWLQIHGITLQEAGQLTGDESGRIVETWETLWRPDMFYATCIEAAMYGGNLEEAVTTRLLEQARVPSVNAERAASLLAEACFMGIDVLGADLVKWCHEIIHRDQQFGSVATCVERLLFLFRYDQVLAGKPLNELSNVLYGAFDRAVWLLDTLGSAAANDMTAVTGIGTLVDVYQQCDDDANLNREYLVEVLFRARVDPSQSPIIRGAATGALWTLDRADAESIETDVSLFRQPEHIGDFLTGLFHRARQILQKKPALMANLDAIVMSFGDEQFLEAVPSMRQAFAYFSPREKAHMVSAILRGGDGAGTATTMDSAPLAALVVGVNEAERALAIEARAKELQRRFGIRGGDA